MLEAALPWPVTLENKVTAMAFAEAVRARRADHHTMLYLYLDQGLGAAFIREGRGAAFSGRDALELGHIRVETPGRPCECGLSGCFETVLTADMIRSSDHEILGGAWPSWPSNSRISSTFSRPSAWFWAGAGAAFARGARLSWRCDPCAGHAACAGADRIPPEPARAGCDLAGRGGCRARPLLLFGRNPMSRKSELPGLRFLSFGLGILAWYLLTRFSAVMLPGPGEVAGKAWSAIESGRLFTDIAASLRRVLSGFLLGTALAIPVGFLMGWYRVARGLLDPWIQFFRMIPPLAIIPLAIITLGIDEAPKIFVIFLAAFLSSVVATYQGVIGVDRTLINAARVLGAKDGVIFARVVVPASLPFILVGCRIGLGSAWATVVAAELIAAQSGLGFRMQQAQLYYDMPTIFVSLITIGILGLAMDRILQLAEKRLTNWQERL
ncbi:ROK family protein [Paracoccus cavernae]|uniref:ROK family protein n=1 Tax=Paracoccus cavernae TaxID=1571207 RepID=A0ABT8DAL4_9RHOB|nr:ROK family protein [Paracoccus cavernae]